MHGQQNIILSRTVSKTLYWDARSAKHYTEMHGQQNIKIWNACVHYKYELQDYSFQSENNK